MDERTMAIDADERSLVARVCDAAAGAVEKAVRRNMPQMMSDIRRMAEMGESPEGVMTVRIHVRRYGRRAADVQVMDCGWRRTVSFRDDDYELSEIDLDQPELPFAGEAAK